jgi:UDP-glucose 4-epimerase
MCISIAQLANTSNIGSGDNSNFRQVLQILQEATNTNFRVELVPERAIDRMSINLDISRAIVDLDWKSE